MAENLVESVREMLKEEKWTRTMSGVYNAESIASLQAVVQKAHDGGLEKEVKEVCDEYLEHTKDCVPALYIAGMLSLESESLDTSRLTDLIGIFQRQHKNDVVEILCRGILEKDKKNKAALRTLANCYKEEKNDGVWPLYEQIVHLDSTEANAARALGEHYEESGEEGSMERAAEYYKTALLRYIKARSSSAAKEMWRKLVAIAPEDLDFFIRTKRDVAKFLSPAISAQLLSDLYKHYKGIQNWDVCIELLKQILTLESDDVESRKEILECYRKKYADVDKTEEYIKASNLMPGFRNVFEAISDFEKHIAFKAGTFVWHKTWGVGKIMSIKKDILHINFGKKRGSTQNETHDLQLKAAVNILTPLSNDHFWVIKATTKSADLKQSVKSDIEGTLAKIIKSFDNKCDIKKIKAELVPSILTSSEWTAWHSAAKKILETSASFGVDPNDAAVYTVLSKNANVGGKIADEFRAHKQFLDRVETLVKYARSPDTDKNSDDYSEMVQYFMGFFKAGNQESRSASINMVNVVVSYLALNEVASIAPIDFSQYGGFPPFSSIYGHILSPREMYVSLKDSSALHLRNLFVKAIHSVPNWEKEYIALFPAAACDKDVAAFIISALTDAGKTDMLTKMTRDCIEAWKDNRNAAVYLIRECAKCDWFLAAGIGQDRLLISLINIIDLTFREIENHVDTVENKKTNKAATALLFKSANNEDCALVKYMLSNGEDACHRMFTLINDIKMLDPSNKSLLRRRILETYSDFVFPAAEEKASAQKDFQYVTAKKLEEKKARLETLNSVDLPRVAAEIAEAKRQGDLKENAEYKAAKEEQAALGRELTRLTTDIAKSVVFDPATATSAVVSFSTEVTLHNGETDKDEVIKVFGPWESDPDNGIYSYLSPLGQALMDKKVGESASSLRDHDFSYYTIKSIKITAL